MNIPEDTPSPIRGNFIPVSGPLTRPPSPAPQGTDLAVHVHLNLTDLQMDRLASALPGHYSPDKTSRRHHNGSDATEMISIGISPHGTSLGSRGSRDKKEPSSMRARSPVDEGRKGNRAARHDRATRYDRATDESFPSRAHFSRSRSPTKRSRSPDKTPVIPHSLTANSNSADRRNNTRPCLINDESARQYASVSKKAVIVDVQPQHESQYATVMSPSTPPLRRMPNMSPVDDDDSSSYYSEDDTGQAHPSYISPLRIHRHAGSDNSVLAFYPTRNKAPSLSPSPERMMHNGHSGTRSPHRRGLQKTATMGDLREGEPHLRNTYSPLSDYLSNGQVPPIRKQLVGTHGWLERTTDTPDQKPSLDRKVTPKATPQKKGGFLDNLKKIAKDVTSSAKDMTSSASRKSREREQRPSRLTVSLDPREQSLLYCEVEFLLTTALDEYITSQFNAGRLDADKYKKIADGWQQRGRPKVVGFRYDLETQLDLVILHSQDFRFFGKRAGLLAAVNGVLDMMRVDARAMRIRTFCQPDTVIAKQLLDAQSLMNLIGACEPQQIQLAEIIQFFKVILEREQNFHQYQYRADAEVVPTSHADEYGEKWRESGRSGAGPATNKDSFSTKEFIPEKYGPV